MISSIIEVFRTQAQQQHKTIRSFYYNRNYEIGSGNEAHPLFWLEDPISGRNQQNTFTNSVNFSILFVPTQDDDIQTLQNLAFSIGLNILERIKHDKQSPVTVLPTWTYLTLRDYYDNNTCGCRFSIELLHRNMQNLCLIDEQFENNKEFDSNQTLQNFEVSVANSCETFVNKLPVFDIKTSKR